MDMQIHTYLTFNGNCREAMGFYKDCLGGDLMFQTVGDSPLSEKLPAKMKDCIVHATLTKGSLVLMGSDLAPHSGVVRGNAVSLSLSCTSETDIHSFYQKLSTGGVADHPLEQSFWGALFGDLTDRYGNHWLLSYQKK